MALTDSTDDNLPVLEPGLVYLSCGPASVWIVPFGFVDAGLAGAAGGAWSSARPGRGAIVAQLASSS